ncbi:hypothetical protein BOO71_0011842 [Deinococcus marmoris]|uniref:Uncharacterized protein n=2 Tax=Deinococcus marmoris TaxID=249408 RepID=A0A1U7NU66_9DEIO|nr:hypothetical protein BOO71_0011842 [Deinococcus marmoris]
MPLAFLLATAWAAPTVQYAELKKVNGTSQTATLTLDYLDFFVLDDGNIKQVMKLGGYRTPDEASDANPSGIYISNTNPQLRLLKTNSKTKFYLVCLADSDPGQFRSVELKTFVASWQGDTPKGCWPFAQTVQLELDGSRIVSVTEVYYP